MSSLSTITNNIITKTNEHTTRLNTHISVPASYHLLEGSLALASTTPTSGFSTTLYTGNGTTQSITTGVDMATQWGDDASERFGGLVWMKARNQAYDNWLYDTLRGSTYQISSNQTGANGSDVNSLTSFNSNGFNVGVNRNQSAATYASWNFQTTHRVSGTTNHGKAYTCHYNPFTGFTIVKYEGSGIAGHEIPHHLGRKLGFSTVKKLSAVGDWLNQYRENNTLFFNLNNAETFSTTVITAFNETNVVCGTSSGLNTNANQYILYGWANSYFDEANKLIGNYEIGVYQGTGSSGNKVKTRGKPAWVMIKRLDSTGNWIIIDNLRLVIHAETELYPNLSSAEVTGTTYSKNLLQDGFSLNGNDGNTNASGGQYLYMVVYDNDSGSGKSKYPKPADAPVINLTAKVPLACGVDLNGTKNTVVSKNETIYGVTLSEGKNYIAWVGE